MTDEHVAPTKAGRARVKETTLVMGAPVLDVAAATDDELRETQALIADELRRRAAAPRPASFGLCEGARDELARTGKSVDPFTSKALTADDLS